MTSPYAFLLCLSCFISLVLQVACTLSKTRSRSRPESDEERLLGQLFMDYNQFARPLVRSSSTVTVALQFSLMHLKDLDIRSQIFTTTGLLILEWKDERLTWLPTEHNDMKEIIVEAKSIWKPELAVINGAEKLYEEYNEFRAVISYNGRVHWEPAGVFKTMCEIDITYYPFDEQRCELTFGSWTYNTGKMNLTTPTDSVNLDSYSRNGEWEVLGTTARRKESTYAGLPGERYSSVSFAIQLRRRHLFYVMNVIMPSLMTSVLLLSVFFCTPAQKVQIGVVVLLSFRIFLLNVAGNIPKTSDHVPLLVIYLTCTLVITTLSMVLTVLVLNLYGTADHPVPVWMRDFVLIFVARTLGMCDTARTYQAAKDVAAASRRVRSRNSGAGLNFFLRTALVGRRNNSHQQQQQQQRADDENNGTTAALELQDRLRSMEYEETCARVDMTLRNAVSGAAATAAAPGTSAAADPSEIERPPDFSKDWKRVAEIVDRLFFWLFLIAFTLSTLVLFQPLMTLIAHKKRPALTAGNQLHGDSTHLSRN